ncbi:3296_t:CDS:1, partial [Funneliformis caledonium]
MDVKNMTAADCKALQNVKVKAPNTGSIEAQINQKCPMRFADVPPPVNTRKENEEERGSRIRNLRIDMVGYGQKPI